ARGWFGFAGRERTGKVPRDDPLRPQAQGNQPAGGGEVVVGDAGEVRRAEDAGQPPAPEAVAPASGGHGIGEVGEAGDAGAPAPGEDLAERRPEDHAIGPKAAGKADDLVRTGFGEEAAVEHADGAAGEEVLAARRREGNDGG